MQLKVRHVDPPGRSSVTPPMDTVIERRRLPVGMRALAIAAAVALVLGLLWLFVPHGNSQRVARDQVTIGDVERGRFDDTLLVRAEVEPATTVYLDAVEGGRVERVLVEDGTMVEPGRLLAVLSNSDLQLNVLARQTEVAAQVNSLRSQELALSQTRLGNNRALIDARLDAQKARRQYEVEAPLAARGFVAGKTFNDTRDTLATSDERARLLERQRRTDERLQSGQLAQLRTTADSLQKSLTIARASLDALNLRAPVAGQLVAFQVQPGQSLSRGQRLGQIDSVGRSKLVAQIDEFYLNRVRVGQPAVAEWNGRRYAARVARIYPQVKNGTFEVDIGFTVPEPPGLQGGQSIQTRVVLGSPSPALLVPTGPFYNDTGGAWVFVLDRDGSAATRRPVRLGRRNSDQIEVLDGLSPGERIVTSSYAAFLQRDRLTLD